MINQKLSHNTLLQSSWEKKLNTNTAFGISHVVILLQYKKSNPETLYNVYVNNVNKRHLETGKF